ncbi:hypothetical protein X564_17540 [Pseudoalteromonas agarivorans]|nr:hypothetical protein X564_17540 [Pseudoalteromonas agarivorans]
MALIIAQLYKFKNSKKHKIALLYLQKCLLILLLSIKYKPFKSDASARKFN